MASLKRTFFRYLNIRFLLFFAILLITINWINNIKNSHHYEEPSMFILKNKIDKIDWHQYSQIVIDLNRKGLGEQGKPAILQIDPKEKEALYAVNGFNGALSDKIALDRSLPDIRHKGCKHINYLKELPTVGVVIPFHNEHWSTLLRTVYSVINRSPAHLMKEVIIVDDASTKEFLKDELDKYVSSNLPKVKIVRLPARRGLITARLAGAEHVTADVIIFLDSHTEANVNWLPPLLEPIALNYTTVMCPMVDVINYEHFGYTAQDEGARGAFDWEFYYKRLPVLPQDELNMPQPYQSPIMIGGLFAISRRFFVELGGYDPELDIWGAEQFELSFKIWQCGGRMYDAPCSRVGHIYRKFASNPNPQHGDFVAKNHKRVAEVWMDEYAKYIYNRRPNFLTADAGDLSKQFALRKSLNCKSFKWFMTKVAFDFVGKYPPIEPAPLAEGRIRPQLAQNMCLDSRKNEALKNITLEPCLPLGDVTDTANYYQGFHFTWRKEIKSAVNEFCLDLPDSTPMKPILLFDCHLGGGNQEWTYNYDKLIIVHGVGDKCIEFDPNSSMIYINWCRDVPLQKWIIDKVNTTSKITQTVRVTGPVEDDGY